MDPQLVPRNCMSRQCRSFKIIIIIIIKAAEKKQTITSSAKFDHMLTNFTARSKQIDSFIKQNVAQLDNIIKAVKAENHCLAEHQSKINEELAIKIGDAAVSVEAKLMANIDQFKIRHTKLVNLAYEMHSQLLTRVKNKVSAKLQLELVHHKGLIQGQVESQIC